MELQTESYVKAKGLILRGAKAAEAASRLIHLVEESRKPEGNAVRE